MQINVWPYRMNINDIQLKEVMPNSNDSSIVFRVSEIFEHSHVPVTYNYNIWESNKEKKYHAIKIVPAANRKIVETEANLIHLTYMYRHLSWIGKEKVF